MADTSIIMFFGDGEHKFHLTDQMISELQRKCGSGIGVIATRLFTQQFALSDITETIRLGLIGGGCNPEIAKAMIDAYVVGLPLTQSYHIALPVINAAYFGGEPEVVPVDTEQPKEEDAA
jgi:hypothetical protein